MMTDYIPGATVVGIAFREGVVLAAEKRFAYGKFIVSRAGKKVFKVTDNVGVACAGMVSDMQALVRYVQALVRLRELESRGPLSARSIAKLMGVLMYERRLIPLITQVIVGGVGESPEVYVLDPLGSVIPDKYASVGSGAEMAISVIESNYKYDIAVNEAKELVIKAIRSAIMRDAASGDGVDTLIITNNGSREESITF